MPGDRLTIKLLSDLWVEEHIFNHLDLRLKTYAGVHWLFSEIEKGRFRAYGVFMPDSSFGGCIYGFLEAPDTFQVHLCLRRRVKAAEAFDLFKKELLADYARDGVKVKTIVGRIPACNRAATSFCRRYGAKNMGIAKFPQHSFMDETGTLLECVEFKMETE
jgi:hypothetical protein